MIHQRNACIQRKNFIVLTFLFCSLIFAIPLSLSRPVIQEEKILTGFTGITKAKGKKKPEREKVWLDLIFLFSSCFHFCFSFCSYTSQPNYKKTTFIHTNLRIILCVLYILHATFFQHNSSPLIHAIKFTHFSPLVYTCGSNKWH